MSAELSLDSEEQSSIIWTLFGRQPREEGTATARKRAPFVGSTRALPCIASRTAVPLGWSVLLFSPCPAERYHPTRRQARIFPSRLIEYTAESRKHSLGLPTNIDTVDPPLARRGGCTDPD